MQGEGNGDPEEVERSRAVSTGESPTDWRSVWQAGDPEVKRQSVREQSMT